MSQFSKRINISPDVLIEYTYDDTNYKSEEYRILTNLKDKTKSYISKSGLNIEENTLLLIDSVNNKYSPVSLTNFNFLRLQSYPASLLLYDKVTIYFTSSFNFYDDQVGFYLDVNTYGYDNEIKYSLTDFFYSKDNLNPFSIFTLQKPFYYNGAYWVKSIEIEIPSIYYVSNQRVVTNTQNQPTLNSLNSNLTNGEGLSINSPIFINFSFISSKQKVLGIDYYYVGDILKVSIPQVPEFDEIGVEVFESKQGDYFEIYGTYLGSNENMDNFVYNETLKGNKIQLNYIVKIYEENILTSTQTFEITENFSQKILYRPIITFSNTTAAIDVELRILNLVDTSYTSKFGSVGITNSINKYGRTLTRLNLDSNVIKTDIYNLKYKNILGTNNNNGLVGINGTVISYDSNYNGSNSVVKNTTNLNTTTTETSKPNVGLSGVPNTFEIVKVPYPVMYDKYNICVNSNKSVNNSDYYSNGLLEIIVTSFDNIINFNVAKDINTDGTPTPYDLSKITNNSKIMLVFKSDTEKVSKEIYNDANNYYKNGILYFKIDGSDYGTLKKIYNAGYDNFYIVISSQTSETQFYSGKYVFYEDVAFSDTNITQTSQTTNPTLQLILDQLKKQENTDTVSANAEVANVDVDSSKNQINTNIATTTNTTVTTSDTTITKVDSSKYTNLMIYVRFQTNRDLFDTWLKTNNITPKYKYSSVYFLEGMEKTYIDIIKKLSYVERVFDIPLETGTTIIKK